MRTEQEIREWGIELRKEWDEHNDIASIRTGAKAALDAVAWILGDTPESDLVRVREAMTSAGLDELSAELFMMTNNDALRGSKPLQYVAIGRADEVIALLRQTAELAAS